jgi:lipooligosaccharide transport system permease protein
MKNSSPHSLQLAWYVVVRNWVVYRKDFLANISPTLADPALMMVALGMGLSPFVGEINGLSYAQYLAPGMVATTVLFSAFFESSYGFYVRMTFESVFKAMLTTPISVREVVIGEFIWGFIRTAMMGAGVGIVLLVMGLLPRPSALIYFPIIAGLLSVPLAAIGLLASALVRNINQFQTVYSFLIAPIYYLSGVFFPLDGHPILYTVAQISPFTHGVSLLQIAAWGDASPGRICYHVGVLLVSTVGLGLWANRQIFRKLTT